LLAAAANGNLDVMRYLVVELGADVNQAEDEMGQAALHIACYAGRLNVVRCLLNELLAKGNKEANSGFTALLFAVEAGHLDLMRCLVREFGADVSHTDYYGETALMIAAASKHAILTKWLVKAGADPQAKNAHNDTAADTSRRVGASPEQTAYLEAKAHCAQPGCSGAGTKKCQGCMQGRYCGPACHVAHWPAHKTECRRLGAALKRAQEEGGK
jgi:ankyrin repeat protein